MDKYLLICALAIATVGAIKDVRGRRIPNWLTYSGLLTGLIVRGVFAGWPGLKDGLLGMLLAGGILLLLAGAGRASVDEVWLEKVDRAA